MHIMELRKRHLDYTAYVRKQQQTQVMAAHCDTSRTILPYKSAAHGSPDTRMNVSEISCFENYRMLLFPGSCPLTKKKNLHKNDPWKRYVPFILDLREASWWSKPVVLGLLGCVLVCA